MTIEELLSISKALKGVTTDIKWEEHLCFNVGGKIFLLTAPDQSPPTATFKVSEEDFNALTERTGITQARYFAKRQWVSVDDLNLLSEKEWKHYIAESYKRVASKLTRKLRTELGIE
jgi:predicted DNA-binding protein (MmcQ/YjbR family)